MFPSLPTETFRRRREALIERLPERGALLVLSLPPAPRNGDVIHPYRPESDLLYLTGFTEPHCALLVTRGVDAPATSIFLRDRDASQEVWTGPRLGVEDAPGALGVDEAHDVGRLVPELTKALRQVEVLFYRAPHDSQEARGVSRALEAVRVGPRSPHKGPHSIVDPVLTLHELRLRKEPAEVDRIREGNRITGDALREVMATTAAGTGEWQIQATLEAAFRREGGWGWGYPTIVGVGPNACVLHYDANSARAREGDLVLIDAGAEVDGYAADVSRTFPVADRFSAPQRELYEVVLDAQRRAIEAARPGRTLEQLHRVAVETLNDGMCRLGLIAGPADEALEQERYKRYYPHQTSHWLGLDVHDVGLYFVGDEPRVLEPGMVFTVEPGLYVPASDDEAPERFRGLGIRIEDDVLVTADGHDDLSAGIPRTIEEIETIRGQG